MTASFDVAIVGAGIVGAACAAECAREGLRVAVIESEFIGGGATAQGMGHIVVMDDSEAQFALTRYSQILWQQLADELPREVEYDACGTIWVAADDEEMAEVRRKQRFYEARGVTVEALDARAVAEAEPNLRKGLVGGLLVPNDSVIYPPCAARYLLEQAQARGASLHIGQPVVQLSEEGVRLRDGTFIATGVVVNAAGSWSPALTPGLAVQKRKGHLVITDRYPGFIRHQLVELGYLKSAHSLTADSVAFNVQPRRTGQVLIGSSRQYGVEDSRVDATMLSRMIARAIEYMPGLARLSAIRAWTGFRAATPDKLPLIGPCPGNERLYLATGHEGLGITTALGTAKLLVDILLKRPSQIPIEPYLPSRARQEVTHA
ncbi:MAG TPA: FAD-dependent oxidoreductase [Blastocatellia bacterium]|nr:FAD-dependent oxidoreductase [Blastocatellia bacterium]